MTVKVFKYECMGETLSFAEGLGWVDWLTDVNDDTDPAQGYVVIYEEELYA